MTEDNTVKINKKFTIPAFNANIERVKSIPASLKGSIPEGAIYFEGYASKSTKDRHGDIISPSFWSSKTIADYLINPVLLYMHNHRDVVGKVLTAEQRADGLFVTGYVSEKWEKAWLVKDGLVNSLSVGIHVNEAEYDHNSDTLLLTTGSWHELSIATIPANKESQFSISKSIGEEEYNKLIEKFKKGEGMKLPEFLKSLIPSLNKWGLGIKDDATADEVITAVDGAKSYEETEREIEERVRKSLMLELTKAIEVKKETEKSELTKAIESAITPLQAKIKSLEEELVTEKAKAKGVQVNSNQPQFETQKSFFDTLGNFTPEGESKY